MNQDLLVRMYNVLAKLEPTTEVVELTNDIWQELGPLPEWATGRNTNKQVIVGAQLCTKDGRKTGNARIIYIKETIFKHCYVVKTDMGNILRLTIDEIEELFWVGDFIMDVTQDANEYLIQARKEWGTDNV